jgi:hypothetical protein
MKYFFDYECDKNFDDYFITFFDNVIKKRCTFAELNFV